MQLIEAVNELQELGYQIVSYSDDSHIEVDANPGHDVYGSFRYTITINVPLSSLRVGWFKGHLVNIMEAYHKRNYRK